MISRSSKALAIVILLCLPALAKERAVGRIWVGTWAASPAGPGPALRSLENQTIREIVHVTIAGESVQVRLSNAFGTEPLTIGAAHLAIRESKSGIVAGSDTVLKFSGRPSVSIPNGAVVVSDPVKLAVPAAADLAISIYLPGSVRVETMHSGAQQTGYLAPGDQTAAATMPEGARTITSWPFLTGVAVEAPSRSAAIVTLGDSITDGSHSTPDTNSRWPDVLARRLLARDRKQAAVAVLNAGIGGNRIWHDGKGPNGPVVGPSALARFDRDVLAQPGVKYLIVLEGINDLGHPGVSAPAAEEVSAEDIIAGLTQIIERGHQKGLRIFGGTITPFEGTTIPGYYTPERDRKREAVNQWIRTSGAFDGVIDFEQSVRDPGHPTRLLARYDCGDHLHPNDAGYKAMGDAIDLSLFRPGAEH